MRPSDFLTSGTDDMAGTGLVGLRNSFAPPCSKANDVHSLSPPISFDVAAYTRILQQMTKLYPYDPAAVAASISALGHTSHLPLAFTGSNIIPQSFGCVSSNSNAKVEDTGPNHKSVSKMKDELIIKVEPLLNIDKALDLSTPGLKSLYSHYRRITMDQIKPKIVEDIWVENDLSLKWTDSKIAAYNPAQKLFMCVDCECVGFLSRVAEHWLGAHANLRVFHCPRCPYTSAWSRCVKMHLTRQHNEQFADTTMWKENATLLEVTRLMQELRTKVETKIDASNLLADKRFYCPHCPYATDRRDLYTRHENIHKDNKPFHCYLCFKQFNRADHVKKHFVRMHPESEYDISKIRKQPTNSKNQAQSSSSSSTASDSPASSSAPPSSLPKPNTTPTFWEPSSQTVVFAAKPDNSNEKLTSSSIPEVPPKISSLPISQEAVSSLSESLSEISVINLTTNSQESTSAPIPQVTTHIGKSPSSEVSSRSRRRGDRAYTCHYCHWSGSDNWCLKRHMNTHIKPFACIMCDYKAARAERLSTHVWKVHNKRICNKCNFLADTQERLLEHTREEHHNNPYSRRHICASCGMSFDTRANLETHIHLAHTRPKSPNDIVHITPIVVSDKVQEIAQDLSMKRHLSGEESLSLICPIEDCSKPCESSGILADHVRQEHGGLFASRCPHCSYNLTQDELAKDHWLTHHEDVCNACVHVFTSVYGPQLWKKVHVRPQSSESPLDAIVNGLNKKRTEPEPSLPGKCESQSNHDLISLHSSPSSPASESHDGEVERLSKRQRKQSCPKKVITLGTESDQTLDITEPLTDLVNSTKTRKVLRKKMFRRKCLKCPHRPSFSSFALLRSHKRLRHKSFLKKTSKVKRLRMSSYS